MVDPPTPARTWLIKGWDWSAGGRILDKGDISLKRDHFCPGIDFKIRTIELDGKKIKLQIWDTAGQERFRTITTAYYRGAMGIMLVYDITTEKSFDNIKNWIRNIEEHASADVEKMILGNKCDMDDRREVTKERGSELAIEYGIKFMETSAKASINVEEAFFTLARDIKAKMEKRLEAQNPPRQERGHQLGKDDSRGRNIMQWLNRCSILLIIFTAYTGNLVAFMTLPGIQSALDTPAKVLEADLPVAMYNYEGSTTIAFSGTKNPLYQSIWKGKQWISNFDQTYAQVERGDMIFMDYRFALEAAVEAQYVDALGRPRLHLAKYNTFRFGTAWAVQPQSMFIEALNHGTLIAEMTGHLIHWKRRTLFQMKADANGQSITIPSEVVAKPLTIGDLQGPILMYCLCIGSACIAFCLESMHGKAKKTQDWHRRAQISMGC
eukprot:maker-scaffold263_size232787-snap-gene-0.15 protein:Tk11199 transcript:maker-scaffold263_size232787-snap-gene-0.15-mRNA-1 annotation:"ras-related protein rab-8a"